jgi:hypothetical protein
VSCAIGRFGRPEPVPAGSLHPPRRRFCRVGADRVPVRRFRGFGASRAARLGGCGCRSRAARRARLERRPCRHGPARARPSRWVGPEQARVGAARAVHRGMSEADFTWAKPSWPSLVEALRTVLLPSSFAVVKLVKERAPAEAEPARMEAITRLTVKHAPRSARDRVRRRVSRAAPPPPAPRPCAVTPLRASPPREDTAPQNRLGEP